METSHREMTRRSALSLLAGPVTASVAAPNFDSSFGSALDAAAAIRARKISSVELTKRIFERIDKFQPKLNAFVYQMRDESSWQRPPG